MLKTINEKLEEITEEQREQAYKYLNVRIEAATLKNYLESELVKRLPKYRASRSNIGVEMAFLARFEDAMQEKDADYIKKKERYEELMAEYKGLDRVLDALNSQSIALQSALKHMVSSEKFHSYEGND